MNDSKNKILIAVPVGHFILPWKFADSLVRSVLYLQNQGLKVEVLIHEGSYIEDNKNFLLNRALTYDFEYLIMLDWDHVFEPTTLHGLYKTAHDKQLDLCSGLYFIEKGLYKYPCLIVNGTVPEQFPREDLFEVDTFAAGFSIMSYKAAKAISQVGGYTRIKGWGEDVSFCHRAKEAGFKVWCHSGFKVGHLRFKEV